MIRALVAYDSKFGNTESVAIRLAILLEEKGIATSCSRVGAIDVKQLTDIDILAIGGPTHSFGMSKPMVEFMDQLRTVNLEGKLAFAFDTRFESALSGSAARRIEALLSKMGARIVVPRYSAFVTRRGMLKQEGIDEELEKVASSLAAPTGQSD